MTTILNVLWFCLEALLIGGYFALDGFDLGSGVLYPFIAKGEQEKGIVRRTIGPIWDGNEVWLLTAGGALFAAFPAAYACTFSGFYLAIILVLFGLIFRAAAVEFATHDTKWHPFWHGAFFVGSLLPALLTGVAIGCVVQGIPMDAAGNYIGIPLFGLITPFSLACGLLGLSFMLWQGASWLALKTPKDCPVQARAAKARPVLLLVSLILFVLTGLLYFTMTSTPLNPNMLCMVLQIVFVVLIIVAFLGSFIAIRKGNDVFAFLCNELGPLALVGLMAAGMFPNLVIASNAGKTVATQVFTVAGGMVPSSAAVSNITMSSAAAGPNTLTAMLIIACIGVPLVLIYHIMTYRIFRGRVSKEGE
jgi:cytochrome d ubiquinol oxidase subunit II